MTTSSIETAPKFAPSRDGRGRLLVVSNRVALPGVVHAGGLAAALGDALRESGGVWIGWSGKRSEQREPTRRSAGNVEYVTLDLSNAEHRGFYLHYANRTLWPLLHSRADLLEHDPWAAEVYRQVNRRFAELVRRVAQPGDLIWVHDYHFLPLASELRRLGVDNPVGMFLHTPFPSPDIAQALPGDERTFGALADYDLVGVQTERDLYHLRRYLRLERAIDPSGPQLRAFPIGIDPKAMSDHAEAAVDTLSYRHLLESLAGRRLVIGVDRLDYSKGLPRRFIAYGEMFERHPELLRQVSYLQIAPISRGEVPEYRELKERLDSLAGSINARYGDADWVPLRYVTRSYKHNVIAGYYRASRVGLVTPLRDGMNLVAKEFVAAQDPQDPGVLVLSEFAGAAEQMKAALQVNPYDTTSLADRLAEALQMPLAERRRRWERLMSGVLEHDVSSWRRQFVDCLVGLAEQPPKLERRAAPRLGRRPLAESIAGAIGGTADSLRGRA